MTEQTVKDAQIARGTALALPKPGAEQMSRALVKAIAADIGKAVAHHIETMYPGAVKATSRNMLVSVRGYVVNEIMAALETTDEVAIRRRLDARKKHRAFIKRAYASPPGRPAPPR